MLRVCSLL